jgi:hypothetical protein
MSRFSIPSLFLILCSTFVYGINSEPVITLNGPNPQYVDSGGVYEELGAESFAPDGTSISDVSDNGTPTDDNGNGDPDDDPTITILTSQPIDNENILLNGNVYITKSNGLIIKSGDECYRIKVNNGNVVAEPVNCEQ